MYFPIIDVLKENFIAKIPSIVTQWLTDNVDPVGSAVVVDTSLSISGAAADAKITGDELNDLKSDIDGISDGTVNLFDKSDAGYILDKIFISSDGHLSADNSSKSVCIPCEPSTLYTISKMLTSRFRIADYAAYPAVTNPSVSSPVTSNASTVLSFTTGATATYLAVYLYDSGDSSINFNDVLDSIQIEKGSKATEYVPYRTAVDVVARNKLISTSDVVDGAITPIKTSFIGHTEGTNYIPEWIDDAYIKDGVETHLVSTPRLFATPKIPLEESTQYYYSSLYAGYYAFYDENDNVLESHNANSPIPNPFTTPANTAYGRFTSVTEANRDASWINDVNVEPNQYSESLKGVLGIEQTYCDYEGNDFQVFNKCLCIGDSLTYGVFNHNEGGTTEYVSYPNTYSYPHILQKISGVECVNEGLASATIDEWWSAHSNDDFSGYDCAVIALGVNDKFRYNAWTNTAETALKNIISALQSENNGIKIFVSTIIPGLSFSGSIYDEISEGIRGVVSDLDDSNVVLLDLAAHGKTKSSRAYNNGHLSAYGYWRLANDIRNYIGYLMNTNKILYRNVQFIGTTYSYTD